MSLSEYTTTEGGVTTLWYERMDISHPPRGIKLEECPNCHRPARVERGAKSDTFIHSDRVNKRDKQRRGYCKPSHNGKDIEVVFARPPVEA